uniref:hypothetical protein n=1 Tax=Halosegnis longus TaxID=2216012 RepID=UPI001EF11256|nr:MULTISPECIES: hypothetical protein [Halobacteriales]
MAGGASAAARDDVAAVGATLPAGVDVLAGAGQGVAELLAKLRGRLGVEYVFLTVDV